MGSVLCCTVNYFIFMNVEIVFVFKRTGFSVKELYSVQHHIHFILKLTKAMLRRYGLQKTKKNSNTITIKGRD